MAGKRIIDLNPAQPIDVADLIEISQVVSTVQTSGKITIQELLDFIKSRDVQHDEDITGTTITLGFTPTFIYGVFMNGQRLISGNDYTVTANVITLNNSASADSFTVVYKH